MKRTLILGFVTVICAASMTSCKKDYTCACKVGGTTLNLEIKDVKKKDAQTTCDQAQATYRIVDATASCGL